MIEPSTLENNLEMINYDFIGYVKDERNRAAFRRFMNYLAVLFYLNELIFGINHNAPLRMVEWNTMYREDYQKIFLLDRIQQVKR